MPPTPRPQGPPFLESVQVWFSTIFAITSAFIATPYIVGFVLPHASSFAQTHYGVGFLMPVIVWPLAFATVSVGVANIFKVLLSRETLRFLMQPR